ncbi:unnamed protein product, partial [marine sediment metagenome]
FLRLTNENDVLVNFVVIIGMKIGWAQQPILFFYL